MALDAKLAAKQAPADKKHHSEEHYSQVQLAWRMVIELVAGLGIGFGIGYGTWQLTQNPKAVLYFTRLTSLSSNLCLVTVLCTGIRQQT